MRFVSKSQEFNREVRKPVYGLIQGPGGPEKHVIVDSIMAQFSQGGLTNAEWEQVRERFSFGGLAEGENPRRRVSIYDTDVEAAINDWDVDTKSQVEQNLLEGQSEWYFLLEEIKADKPWPSYDAQTPKQILETVAVTGANIEAVIAYERENKNRVTLVTELKSLIATEEPEPLVAA